MVGGGLCGTHAASFKTIQLMENLADKLALPAGYSGTPLAKKLGIKTGFNMALINAPEYYFSLFTDLPCDLTINDGRLAPKDFIHFFTKQKGEYLNLLPGLKQQIKPNGIIWVSWPKKASK